MATPAHLTPAGTPLARQLAAEIRRDGPMPFAVFMGRCLYDPICGYYTTPGRDVGRRGDFFTSVSVGPVFGELIAIWVERSWRDMGSPPEMTLIEQGGHDGHLMADVLEASARHRPALLAALRPVIVEPLTARREAQTRRLSRAGVSPGAHPVAWASSLEAVADRPRPHALFFANELLDAFPVARWRRINGHWHQLSVGLDAQGAFTWVTQPAPDFAPPALDTLPAVSWPDGFETESCPALAPWTQALAAAIPMGRALIFDYGREAGDYFAPHRTAGTLRGYSRHQRSDDPLAAPGETDLTADVNFSHLAEAARQAGFVPNPPQRQGAFLTRLAADRLLHPPPPDPSWRRQFQTLTHPNHLGHQFHAVVLEKPPSP